MANTCPKCNTDNPDTVKFCGECGTQLSSIEDIGVTETIEAPKEELTRGTTFADRYEIIEVLGKGGMGKVYRVEDTKLNQEVALKLIKPEIASDKKTIERFRNELKTARMIAHKNVCRMFDLGESGGSNFITMEYIRGEDLKSLVRKMGQLSAGQALTIAKQVCDGLIEAHNLGVVHRDLKPQNIMIDTNGNARIMDFGIARSIEGKGITGAGVMIGTPDYMSPEQVDGKETDQRSDIYSLGVILFEMVTGQLPFVGDTPLSIAMKHKGETPKIPKEYNAQIPDGLSKLILKCLEKDKESRYQSAGEVQTELKNIEKGIPTTDRTIPKRKPFTLKEITVKFGLKKLVIPALVVIALITIGVIIWQFLPKKETVTLISDKPSIAILPFVDLSPQEDQAYFCDGLADELINRLTRIENLRVPARTSSFAFKGKDIDIREVGEKLNVDKVLEGSVRRSGNRIRITTQLINIANGYHIWSEQYEREMEDIFKLQDEISLMIADKLKLQLLDEEKIGLTKRLTENVEAYNLYCKGRYFLNKRTEDDLKNALKYFKQAIESDGGYALAFTGLADTYITLGDWNYVIGKEAYSKAKAAATKAIELDDLLPEAHNSLAVVKWTLDLDWINAEKEFKRALELNPNYVSAYQEYAEYLSLLGRFDEAISEIDKAIELDQLSPLINGTKALVLFHAREYDKSIEQCRKTLEIDTEFPPAFVYLGYCYIQKKMYEEALAMFQKAELLPQVALTKARMGKIEEARELIDVSFEQKFPALTAIFHFISNEKDKGFEWLEIAYENRGRAIMGLKVHPSFDDIRSDPRFRTLIKKMNLE